MKTVRRVFSKACASFARPASTTNGPADSLKTQEISHGPHIMGSGFNMSSEVGGSGPTPTTGNHGANPGTGLEANAVQLVTSSCPVAGQLQPRPGRPEALATIGEEAHTRDGWSNPGTSSGADDGDLRGLSPANNEAKAEVSSPAQVRC